MIFKIRISHWRFTFTFAPVTDVVGVNSNLPDGKHIIMWDFDDIPLWLVRGALEVVATKFRMPNIYIFTTGAPDHYVAYCFKRVCWSDSVMIVATTAGVDPNFFKYGVYRGHWTLRVTPKEGRKPRLVQVLASPLKEDCFVEGLNSWTKYETLADSAPMKKMELNLIGTR